MCPVGSTDNQRSHTWKCQSESFSNDSCFKLKECDTDVYDDEQISSFLSVCLYYPCFTTLCFTFLMKAIKPSKKQVLYIYIYNSYIYKKQFLFLFLCILWMCWNQRTCQSKVNTYTVGSKSMRIQNIYIFSFHFKSF